MDPVEPSSSASSDPLSALRRPVAPSSTDRLRALIERVPREARPWAAAVVVVAVVAVAVGTALVMGIGSNRAEAPVGGDDSLFDLPMATSAPAVDTTVPRLVVHAAGAVSQPGVYSLAVGARVDDLIGAAGGLAPDADADRLNLAAPMQDGARLYVPRRGEPDVPSINDPDGAGAGSAPPNGAGAPSAGPIDLNRASATELETLPGIGPSLAQAIVDHRTRHGPFSSVDELLDVRGIGPTRLEQLRALVKV